MAVCAPALLSSYYPEDTAGSRGTRCLVNRAASAYEDTPPPTASRTLCETRNLSSGGSLALTSSVSDLGPLVKPFKGSPALSGVPLRILGLCGPLSGFDRAKIASAESRTP